MKISKSVIKAIPNCSWPINACNQLYGDNGNCANNVSCTNAQAITLEHSLLRHRCAKQVRLQTQHASFCECSSIPMRTYGDHGRL